jgi:hypothetical protein
MQYNLLTLHVTHFSHPSIISIPIALYPAHCVGSLIFSATENIRTLTESWKTGFTHMDKKSYSAFANALKESEIRCDPSLFVEGMSLLLQSLKPANLLPTVGTSSARLSLISSLKTQCIAQVAPSYNNSKVRCNETRRGESM